MDVKGAMATADMREVVVQPCQTMDSNHTREQRWHVAAGGAVVSELSGLCMDLEGSAEEAVAVQRRRWGARERGGQLWRVSTEGAHKGPEVPTEGRPRIPPPPERERELAYARTLRATTSVFSLPRRT